MGAESIEELMVWLLLQGVDGSCVETGLWEAVELMWLLWRVSWAAVAKGCCCCYGEGPGKLEPDDAVAAVERVLGSWCKRMLLLLWRGSWAAGADSWQLLGMGSWCCGRRAWQ